MMEDVLRKLVEAAVLAPSGDNLQPWRFIIDEQTQTITITFDKERAIDVFDPGYQFAFVAIGAAVENIIRTAQLNGLAVKVEYRLIDLAVVVTVEGSLEEAEKRWRVDSLLADRMTNRSLYDGRVLDQQIVRTLRQTTPSEGFKAYWITGRERIEILSDLVRQSDSMLFGIPEIFESFVQRIDFSRDGEQVSLGMPVQVLGAQGLEKWVLYMSSKLPRWVMPNRLGGWLLGQHAKDLLASASGVCVVTASSEGLIAAVQLGRVVQNIWLMLTELGLAVQPMGSLYILDYIASHPASVVKRRLQRSRVENLLQEFREIVPEIGKDRLAFMLRFGYGQAPSERAGRLPVEQVMERVHS